MIIGIGRYEKKLIGRTLSLREYTTYKQKRYSMDIVAYFFKCQMKQQQLHMVSVAIKFWQLKYNI